MNTDIDYNFLIIVILSYHDSSVDNILTSFLVTPEGGGSRGRRRMVVAEKGSGIEIVTSSLIKIA